MQNFPFLREVIENIPHMGVGYFAQLIKIITSGTFIDSRST